MVEEKKAIEIKISVVFWGLWDESEWGQLSRRGGEWLIVDC
jgi:hypothetical protein